MRTSLTRAGLIVAAATSVVLGLTACSSADVDTGPDENGDPVNVVEVSPGNGGPPTTIDAGEGDYVFGLGRDSIVETVVDMFSSEHATAEWEGDTLVVTMDGNTEAPMAGWTECRVVTELVEPGDAVAFVFPNGRLECADVLAE